MLLTINQFLSSRLTRHKFTLFLDSNRNGYRISTVNWQIAYHYAFDTPTGFFCQMVSTLDDELSMTQYYYGNLSPSRRRKTRKNKDILRTKQAIIQVKFRAEKNLKTCRIFTLPDPGLEIRRGSVIHTLRKGGRRSPKKFFSTLRASVWSRNKRGTQVPRAPPLDPQLI